MIRIGILQLTQHLNDAVNGFKAAIAAAGLSQNVEFIYHNVEGRTGSLPAYANRLIDAQVKIIFACSTPAAQSALDAAAPAGIPVLFTPVFDPVGAGLVQSLAKPNGNATGASGMVPAAKKIAFIRQLLPKIHKLGILYHCEDPNACLEHRIFREAAAEENLVTVDIAITNAAHLSRLPELLPVELDALFLPIGKIIEENFATVQYYADEAELPIIASHGPNVSAGALGGLVSNHYNLGTLCGEMAIRILSGMSISEISVATPQQLDILLNAAVAENLGIVIPEVLMQKAAEVY